MKPNDAIRNYYENLGVEKFYKEFSKTYTNPHEKQIEELIEKNASKIDYKRVLDFCAGSGEITLALKKLGYSNTVGSDPYTHELYTQKTEKNCYNWSFKDVIESGISGNYSSIICSFAMHLCRQKDLYPLVFNLFQKAKTLVVITPHKRPELHKVDHVNLNFEDYVLTEKGKKVWLKSYAFNYLS